jgi:aminopeptidase N
MHRAALLIALAALAACGRKEKAAEAAPAPMEAPLPSETAAPVLRSFNLAAQKDQFSYANVEEVRTTHVDLNLTVDFETKTLDGAAILDLVRVKPDADTLILDTDDLAIKSVEARIAEQWSPAPFVLGTDDPKLGAPLQIALPPNADAVRIAYRTSPGAQGLQWLTKEQTAGKRHPFMYS